MSINMHNKKLEMSDPCPQHIVSGGLAQVDLYNSPMTECLGTNTTTCLYLVWHIATQGRYSTYCKSHKFFQGMQKFSDTTMGTFAGIDLLY